MITKFPFDKQELKENPDSLIDLVEQLWNDNQYLQKKIEKLEENKQARLLEKEVARLQAELAKYTSPHIPSSKQLYPKNNNIKKMIKSGLPTKAKGKRGGSKKGNGRKKARKYIHSWAYSKLTMMLEYKLSAEGYNKRFINVSEAFTSIKCWKCGKKGKRPQQSNFYCSNYNCKWRGNADMNGSINIAKRAIDYFQLTGVINKRRNRLLTNKSLSNKVRGQGVAKPTPAEPRLVGGISEGISSMIDQSNRAKRLKYSNTRYKQGPESNEILNKDSKKNPFDQRGSVISPKTRQPVSSETLVRTTVEEQPEAPVS